MSDAWPVYPVGSVGDGSVQGPDDSSAPYPFLDDDLDAALDVMLELAGETPRRHGRSADPAARVRSTAHDRSRRSQAKIELILYTSAASEKSQRALRTVKQVLSRYVASQVNFSTCDLSVRTQDGEVDAVVFTPTLVKQGPGPRTAIIGNLEHEDVLYDLLDASGVDRRWDD